MRIFRKIIAAVLLFFFLFNAPSTAEIISKKLRSDNRSTILFSEFGFSHTGHVSFDISSVSINSNLSEPDPSRIGFFLLSFKVEDDYLQESRQNPELCPLDNNFISLLFTFQDHVYPYPQSSFNKTYPVSYPGVHALYFANCNHQSLVTMDVRTELYNIDVDGTTKNYLPVGLTQLPSLYFIFSLLYMCFLGVWIFVCFKNKLCFRKIHLVMGVLLAVTLIHVMSAATDQHYLKVTGIHGWDVLFYIFRFIRTVLCFTVIVLISGGWCLWSPSLQEREKVVLLVVFLFQVIANGFVMLIGETGFRNDVSPYNEHWLNWNIGFVHFDFLTCFVIFVPICGSYSLLNETCEVDGNAAKNLAKLLSFTKAVSVYLFMRIVVNGFADDVVYEWPWVINAGEEIVSLVFCMVMFYMYRPFVSDDDDDEKSAG